MSDKKLTDWWQKLNRCSCVYVPSKLCFLITIGIVCVFSFIFFVAFIASQASIVRVSKRYDELCPLGVSNCTIEIEIEEDMESPVFVYYELHNFFQNHRIYARSFSMVQLIGDTSAASEDCDPIIDIEDLKDHMTDHTLTLLNEDNSADANPCGLISSSVFNDTIVIKNNAGTPYTLDTSDIVFSSDDDIFKNTGGEWTDKEDPRFIVWMRTAQHSNFMKLYGKIDDNINSGNTLLVDIIPTTDFSSFHGEKHVVLSTVNSLGSSNNVLGWFFFLCWIVSLAEIVAFFLIPKCRKTPTAAQAFGLDEQNQE